MPPKKTPRAPTGRVYTSLGVPPRQTVLPYSTKTIRYGKQVAKKIIKQSTLTQLDDWPLISPLSDEEGDDGIQGKIEVQEEEVLDPTQPKKKRRKTSEHDHNEASYQGPKNSKRSRRKTAGEEAEGTREDSVEPRKGRRKTTGDEQEDDQEEDYKVDERRTKRSRKAAEHEPENDVEEYVESKSVRMRGRKCIGAKFVSRLVEKDQSTLTQSPHFFEHTAARNDDYSIYDVPSSSPQLKNTRQSGPNPYLPIPARYSSRQKSVPAPSTIPEAMPPPQTPHRRLAHEIPSSESPATPPSRISPVKSSILTDRSINIPIYFAANATGSGTPKLPRLRVEDTFESEDVSPQTRVLSTPSKQSSPTKTVRFASSKSPGQVDVPSATAFQSTPAPVKNSTRLVDEILDSDAESDGYYEAQDDCPEDEDVAQETCYGEIGLETQGLLETQKRVCSTRVEDSHALDTDILDDEIEEEHNDFFKSRELGEEEVIEERTQYMESQRLATQHFHLMAPRTAVSDAFISIQPQIVTKIVNRTQDHDFRHQKIPNTVSRVWIYETAPVQIMRYMAEISGVKRPGEIMDEHGEGNAEFNAKNPNNNIFAYEITGLFELSDPLHWETIESNEWLSSPPRKATLVRPAVLGQLFSNLQPPIFCDTPPYEEEPSSDTQEAEEQLLSTMKQYTHPAPEPDQVLEEELESGPLEDEAASESRDLGGEVLDSAEGVREEPPHSRPSSVSHRSTAQSRISSSQLSNEIVENHSDPIQHTPHHLPQPTMAAPSTKISASQHLPTHPDFSQASTVDLTQTPKHSRFTNDIVMESPERPISIYSSTPLRLPTLRDREGKEGREYGPLDSLVPLSLSSSQLLTRSQMLPASLLRGDMEGPPGVIADSEEEEEEDDEL